MKEGSFSTSCKVGAAHRGVGSCAWIPKRDGDETSLEVDSAPGSKCKDIEFKKEISIGIEEDNRCSTIIQQDYKVKT
jgi:hypothetical protein